MIWDLKPFCRVSGNYVIVVSINKFLAGKCHVLLKIIYPTAYYLTRVFGIRDNSRIIRHPRSYRLLSRLCIANVNYDRQSILYCCFLCSPKTRLLIRRRGLKFLEKSFYFTIHHTRIFVINILTDGNQLVLHQIYYSLLGAPLAI